MIKKLLLSLLVAATYSQMSAQCTPDPNYVPTSPTGAGVSDLPCAKLNQPYSETATVVVPTHPTISGLQPYICKVRVDSVNNIPAGTNVQYPIFKDGVSYGLGQQITLNPANATERACIQLSADAFTASFNDSIRIVAYAYLYSDAGCTLQIPVVSPYKVNFALHFSVSDTCSNGVGLETVSNNSFDVYQNYPNPVTGNTQIMFTAPAAGKANFKLTNMVGAIVEQRMVAVDGGKNFLNLNGKDLAAGIYMYSITLNGKTITRKMIVAEK